MRGCLFAGLVLSCSALVASGEDPGKGKASATELGRLAGCMKPGTWAELKTKGYTSDLLQVQNHHILEYTDTAVWDPRSGQVLFVGQGHYSAVKFIAYDEATNSWKLLPTPSWWKGDPKTGKGPIGHAYNNNAIDPARGILYHHQSAMRLVHAYDVAEQKWRTLPEIKGAAIGHGTALAWFPEMKGLVRVYGGTVHFYSPEKNAWSVLKAKLPMGPYHNIAKYSAPRKVVILGAGNNSKTLYQLDAEGRFTRLPDAPFVIRISSTMVTVDPIRGDLLVLNREDKSRFYTLDLDKKEWKRLPDAPIIDGVAAPISTHGVNLVMSHRPLKVHLYKHSAKP
jgi:hypothetical protein